MKHLFAFLFLLGITFSLSAQSVRERILLDDGWQFAFGNASSPEKDFGCGTEYFNYLTKAASIHNEGPYSPKFNPEKWGVGWKTVNLPHDWVVDLPYAKEASHSHGYKAVGYKFPENSVGWYRKTITVPQEDLGKHLYLQFDGIFRDARIWINGFYLGHEPSGYATQVYDITEYLNYGDLPLDRPDLFFTEETPIHTSSPYSSSKAGADLLVLAYHRTYGLPVTISRCSNNYGPYHFPEKLIPLMIANALNDKPLPVYGKGENVRDWLYVEDHCKAIDLIIHNGRVGEVYNIGGHNEMKNIDIVKIICKELGKPESLITYVSDRKGHDMRYAIDPTKIHNELGWLPETKFADGIKKTIQWYLDNKEWWETIISGEYQNYYEKMYANR